MQENYSLFDYRKCWYNNKMIVRIQCHAGRGIGSLFGTLVGSGIAACLIYGSLAWGESDLKKIRHTFRNINYKVKNHEPKLIKKTSYENKTEYVFSVPYGLIDDSKLQPILQKTLAKPVTVKFKGKLIINVYDDDLPTKINYDWEQSTNKWVMPVGISLDGFVYHDFDKIPHMTVAGMTRQGKTVFLKLMFAHLINNNSRVEFHIIDLKGGLEFGRYEKLKQVKTVASDSQQAESCLQSITNHMRLDMELYKEKGWNNVVNTAVKRRAFIIVDEAAELADNKECQKHLSEIARIGGALGYRLIFATQYPTADTLPRQIKQNADAKISFRLPTEVASRVAIDEQGAEKLSNPGRAIYRTHERYEVQVPYISDNEILEKLRRYEVDKTPTKDKTTGKNIIKFE